MISLTQNSAFLITAALLIGLICGWLISRLQSSQRLQKLHNMEQHEREQLLQQVARLEAQLAAEKNSSSEKLQLLNETRQQLEENFRALSSQALVANNQNFLDLAKSTLGSFQKEAQGDLETRHQAINQLVQPLQESLQKVDHKIEQLEQKRSGAYARLDEQLKSLLKSQVKLESETGNLVRALRAPAVRGRWGGDPVTQGG